jgi:hypothetical protein
LGIPVTWEFTPQWAYRALGHDWNTVRDKNGRYIPFIICEIKPGEPNKPGERMAKAYRHTYEWRPESLIVTAPEEEAPSLFRNPFLRDVSSGNFEGADVSIHLKPPYGKCRYAYLSVWDNRNWYPIQWAEWNQPAVFTGMGRDIVYLPVCYRNRRLSPCQSPFILTRQGGVRLLEADTIRRQTLELTRKYPLINRWVIERMKGGQFHGANRPDFSDAVHLHAIPNHPEMVFHEVYPGQPCQYRYYRYLSPPGGSCNIAELEFYGADGKRITGEMIGTPGSYDEDPARTFDKAFDGDVLTFFDAADKDKDGAWAGMDFGKKTALTKIRYLPRNDDNNVVPGQLYELFYWEDAGWASLGRQMAADYVLHFENAPLNALFLLRNLSKGKEERIFTYENGKQVWW